MVILSIIVVCTVNTFQFGGVTELEVLVQYLQVFLVQTVHV